MPFKALTCLCLWLSAASVSALITEDSASSSALSGITLLSNSVSDFALSPTIPATGASFSYHLPFSMPQGGVYSLNTASRAGDFILSGGACFIEEADYRWQDFHLGAAYHYENLSAGCTQHLIYEWISTDNSWFTWASDIALSYRGEDYGSEIKWLHIGQQDAQIHFTASRGVIDGVTCSGTYVYAPHEDDRYVFATSCNLVDFLTLQSSWQNDPSRFGIGLKFIFRSGEIMYAVRTHPELSLSHSLDIGFRW
jgi:hypothetical protein